MEIFREIGPLRAFLRELRSSGKSIGLVPTMGALHAGHQALVQQSIADNDVTVCSVYVNPTQFNNPSDLEKYPRQLDADSTLLQSIGCTALFAPSDTEMYPTPVMTGFDFGHMATHYEGAFRPGHFSGVGVVVTKLFQIVQPDFAYFGLKDFQQYSILARMVQDLHIPVQLVGMPTVRDEDGLALSSRNQRLNSQERVASTVLFRALTAAVNHLHDGGRWEQARELALGCFRQEPLSRPEYFEWVGYHDLKPLTGTKGAEPSVILTASWIGGVRLIDNLIVQGPS